MIDRSRLAELREEVGATDLEEVVQLFCEEVEETLSRMQQQGPTLNPDELHFLKGSALNIGLQEVGRLCQKAEAASEQHQTDILQISEIKNAFEVSRLELMTELARLNGKR